MNQLVPKLLPRDEPIPTCLTQCIDQVYMKNRQQKIHGRAAGLREGALHACVLPEQLPDLREGISRWINCGPTRVIGKYSIMEVGESEWAFSYEFYVVRRELRDEIVQIERPYVKVSLVAMRMKHFLQDQESICKKMQT